MTVSALSTNDNPFNPIDDYDRWYAFDQLKGYKSSEILAKHVFYDDLMSPEDIEHETRIGIAEVIELYPQIPFVLVEKAM